MPSLKLPGLVLRQEPLYYATDEQVYYHFTKGAWEKLLTQPCLCSNQDLLWQGCHCGAFQAQQNEG